MALITPTKYNKKVKYPEIINWISDDNTSTGLSNKVQEYTSGYLYTPWDNSSKIKVGNSIENIIKDYTYATDETNDLTWNLNYEINSTSADALYVTVPEYEETITATGSANVIITYGAGAATVDYNYVTTKPLTKEEQIRQQLRQKLVPQILIRRFGIGHTGKDSEKKAREALRAIIGDQRFQRYLKHGFITVKGQSGLVYQIFPGHTMTRVWRNGQPVEKLCVVFCDSSVPPTDSVIMRLLMVLDSEEEFRQKSNIMGFSEHEAKQPLPSRIAA